MNCPRCGGSVVSYSLQESESYLCEGCGYVGITAEHDPSKRHSESWDDVLDRFYATANPMHFDAEMHRSGHDPLKYVEDDSSDDRGDERFDRDRSDHRVCDGPDLRTLLEDVLPGSGERLDRRIDAVLDVYDRLRTTETGTRATLAESIDPEPLGYESVESFWSNAARVGLNALPGVDAPEPGDGTWRYRSNGS